MLPRKRERCSKSADRPDSTKNHPALAARRGSGLAGGALGRRLGRRLRGRNSGGDLATALGRIKAKTYVMPISHDMFFPPGDCEVEQRLIPGSQFRPLKSICGHLGLIGVDPELLAQLDANLNELLAAPVN